MHHCIQLKKRNPYWSMSRLDSQTFYTHLANYFRIESSPAVCESVDWLEAKLTTCELQKLAELFGWYQESCETLILAPVHIERYQLLSDGFSMDVLSQMDESWHTLEFVRI